VANVLRVANVSSNKAFQCLGMATFAKKKAPAARLKAGAELVKSRGVIFAKKKRKPVASCQAATTSVRESKVSDHTVRREERGSGGRACLSNHVWNKKCSPGWLTINIVPSEQEHFEQGECAKSCERRGRQIAAKRPLSLDRE